MTVYDRLWLFMTVLCLTVSVLILLCLNVSVLILLCLTVVSVRVCVWLWFLSVFVYGCGPLGARCGPLGARCGPLGARWWPLVTRWWPVDDPNLMKIMKNSWKIDEFPENRWKIKKMGPVGYPEQYHGGTLGSVPCPVPHYPGTHPPRHAGPSTSRAHRSRCLSGHDEFTRLLLESTVGLENTLIHSVVYKPLKSPKSGVFHGFYWFSQRWFLAGFMNFREVK